MQTPSSHALPFTSTSSARPTSPSRRWDTSCEPPPMIRTTHAPSAQARSQSIWIKRPFTSCSLLCSSDFFSARREPPPSPAEPFARGPACRFLAVTRTAWASCSAMQSASHRMAEMVSPPRSSASTLTASAFSFSLSPDASRAACETARSRPSTEASAEWSSAAVRQQASSSTSICRMSIVASNAADVGATGSEFRSSAVPSLRWLRRCAKQKAKPNTTPSAPTPPSNTVGVTSSACVMPRKKWGGGDGGDGGGGNGGVGTAHLTRFPPWPGLFWVGQSPGVPPMQPSVIAPQLVPESAPTRYTCPSGHVHSPLNQSMPMCHNPVS
mmetsp:Transcript_10317/g.34134  ORF Transcript_10317/g.34134 Transcript_10317/m.34134 type:complete len:326 (-) Transcript_10317:334-1311(-)